MKLLVTGNIGYITTEFIEEAFPECQILLLGETEQKQIAIRAYRYTRCRRRRKNSKTFSRRMNLRE